MALIKAVKSTSFKIGEGAEGRGQRADGREAGGTRGGRAEGGRRHGLPKGTVSGKN